jgi:hypothetical protein
LKHNSLAFGVNIAAAQDCEFFGCRIFARDNVIHDWLFNRLNRSQIAFDQTLAV